MTLDGLAAACKTFVAARTAADPAHDLSHIKRVVNNALYLTDIEGCDKHVTLPAAWLHDCVPVSKDSFSYVLGIWLSFRELVSALMGSFISPVSATNWWTVFARSISSLVYRLNGTTSNMM